jgi:hypothetical protein
MRKGSAAALILTALVLAASGSAGAVTAQPGPLLQATANELRLSQPLKALDARGGRAAFAFCNQLVGVWRPGSGVTQLGPSSQWACPPPRGLENVYSLALAGDRVAWAAQSGGNQVTSLLFMAVLGQPETITLAADFAQCCRPFPDPDRIGDVYGDGSFIAFSSRVKCGDRDAPACPGGGSRTTLLSQTVWALRRPPFQAPCVNRPGPCAQLARRAGVLEPLSIDSGRIVLRLADGSVLVRRSGGALVRRFPGLAGRTRAAELMGNRLVVLVPGRILELSLATGRRVSRHTVPNVPSGGVCGTTNCPPVTLRLLDASRGLVAYMRGGQLRLLRLRDGRDAAAGAATDARFGDTGLFHARTGAAPWPARIRFVPWASLPVQP